MSNSNTTRRRLLLGAASGVCLVNATSVPSLPAGWRIGDTTVSPPILLAPMAGISDTAFRATCFDFGCPLAFSEVVSAAGLVYRSSGRTMYLLECGSGDAPVVAHLYGNEPDLLAGAASIVESLDRFVGIDLNCGCPVRRITARGCGVALMKDPGLIGDIVRAIRGTVKLPVTVKTRLGLDPEARLVDDVAQSVEEAGAKALIVHARYASQHHNGPADWEALAELVSTRTIPIVGNGGIEAAPDANRMLAETGVAAVMVGRRAWGRPWFFREAVADMRGEPAPAEPDWSARRETIERHFSRMLTLREREHLFRKSPPRPPAESASLAFRPHLLKYLRGTPVSGFVRRNLNKISSPEALHEVLDRAEDQAERSHER